MQSSQTRPRLGCQRHLTWLEGPGKAILRVLSCRIRAIFLFPLGTFSIYERSFTLRLPYEEWRLPLFLFRVRRKCSNRCPLCVLKTRPHCGLNDSKSPSPIFPLKGSISGKTGLSDSSSYEEGAFRKGQAARQAVICFGFHCKQVFNRFELINSFKNFILFSMIRAVFHIISLQVSCPLIGKA